MTLPGHEPAWREWRKAMAGERMHHAWLLAGKRGLGKAAFADAAARALLGAAESGDHPDIVTLTHPPKDDKEERKRAEGKPYEVKRNITVAQIRAMQRRLTTRPTLGDRRAIIVNPADDMEKGASNALLKSLEEPPQGTFFLLVSHAPARLLPTIRSRCRVLRFQPLASGEIAQFLSEHAPEADHATRDAAIAASGGSPGAALGFVEMELGAMAQLMQQIAQQGDADFTLRGRLAQQIGARPQRERIQAILDLARAVLAQRMGDAQPGEGTALADAHANLVTLAGQAPTYNFDAGLLVMEIGGLLARAGVTSASANA
ncbi:MAG: DNA polymerase III subunit delta' [Alteripontixanthobacter sp.]